MLKLSALILMLLISCSLKGQEPFQQSSTNKIIGTAFDTVKLGGLTYSLKQGVVTNDDIAFPLYVYFSYPGKTYLDSSSLVIIQPGSYFKYSTYGRRIFRRTTVNDGYKKSQVLEGANVEISGKKVMQNVNYQGRDFEGQTINGWDLTGCIFDDAEFAGALIKDCILKNCSFKNATSIDDTILRNGAQLLPTGEYYDFTGVNGDVIIVEP